MSDKSGIVWTDATWSPVTGCSKVSTGCKNCYAEREVESRWSKNPKSVFYGRAFTDVRCHSNTLEQPLHWKKPRKIFVCPRGDLFHEDVPDQFIADVFGIMAAASQHTFQVLTKRPERALQLLGAGCMGGFEQAVEECLALYSDKDLIWPLPNVWFGVSVEDQAAADERIPRLMETPAVVHWISVEPMLGAVSCTVPFDGGRVDMLHRDFLGHPRIDWVVVGGESGHKARPMHPDWVRSLRDQCAAADVPFLFKQWGEWAPNCLCKSDKPHKETKRPEPGKMGCMFRCGTKAAGNLLDGQEWNQYPEVTA